MELLPRYYMVTIPWYGIYCNHPYQQRTTGLPHIQEGRNCTIDAGYEHKGRLQDAAEMMRVSALMFVDIR